MAIPASAAATRGTRYYDPLATFGFLAAHTERIRFVTHVLVELGYLKSAHTITTDSCAFNAQPRSGVVDCAGTLRSARTSTRSSR